ncbi:hypothetical protein ACIPY5_03655 [Microbacterium sp. NPDC089698]|uniref:hypothetical protein n=1 Tax=Microbacterium sp. NPDC089698 TaxID=3364200 RepID=UPI003821370B
MRDLMAEALSDQDRAQRILQGQIREQLKTLDGQEENLLDLAADPDLPKAKIKSRLLDIARDGEALRERLTGVTLDLSEGAWHLDAALTLLENPFELYGLSTDEVRRRLNQAILDGIFITDEAIAEAAMHEPHGHLFAAQSAHLAARAGRPASAISAAFNTA